MSLEWWAYVLIATLSILGGFAGSYLRKKGELKVINEEYENILSQLKKQTEETENIKNQFEKQFSVFESKREWSKKVENKFKEKFRDMRDELYQQG
jgi:hypothetical protein